MIAGLASFITINCALIVPNPPNWLILFFEIPTYVLWTYQSMTWITANIVAYGFLMYYDYMILLSDFDMKKFCFGTCLISSAVSLILDYYVPISNTVMYFLFRGKPDIDRYVFIRFSMSCKSFQSTSKSYRFNRKYQITFRMNIYFAQNM